MSAQHADLKKDAHAVDADEHAGQPHQTGRFSAGKDGVAGGQSGHGLCDCGDHVKEKGRRIADGDQHVRRSAKEASLLRAECKSESQQGQDPENVRLAKASVLENPEACQARQKSCPEIEAAERTVRRNLAVAKKARHPGRDSNQADCGVDDPKIG